MEWNTAAIRDMLSAAFSDQELTTLCFDYFRPVYEDISGGMSKLTLQEKALPLEQVERRMRASKARRLIITLDACHTGVEMGRDLGVFTYYLLQGLGGQADQARKGLVTVDDLKTYVLDNLRRWNVKYGGLLQEPTARTEGLGDIILADYRDRPLAPP